MENDSIYQLSQTIVETVTRRIVEAIDTEAIARQIVGNLVSSLSERLGGDEDLEGGEDGDVPREDAYLLHHKRWVDNFLSSCCSFDAVGLANVRDLWSSFIYWEQSKLVDQREVGEITIQQFETIIEEGYPELQKRPWYDLAHPIEPVANMCFDGIQIFENYLVDADAYEMSILNATALSYLDELERYNRHVEGEDSVDESELMDDDLLVRMFVNERCYFHRSTHTELFDLWIAFMNWKKGLYDNVIGKIIFGKIIDDTYNL